MSRGHQRPVLFATSLALDGFVSCSGLRIQCLRCCYLRVRCSALDRYLALTQQDAYVTFLNEEPRGSTSFSSSAIGQRGIQYLAARTMSIHAVEIVL